MMITTITDRERELLQELRLAHQIIRNALNVMHGDDKIAWARLNAQRDCDGEGITRANEREALLNRFSVKAA